MSSNILDAIAEIRLTFKRAGLNEPEAIVLSSHEDGMKLMRAVDARPFIAIDPCNPPGTPIERPDGSVWMEARVLGLKVRWPAQKWAMREGGYRWV